MTGSAGLDWGMGDEDDESVGVEPRVTYDHRCWNVDFKDRTLPAHAFTRRHRVPVAYSGRLSSSSNAPRDFMMTDYVGSILVDEWVFRLLGKLLGVPLVVGFSLMGFMENIY